MELRQDAHQGNHYNPVLSADRLGMTGRVFTGLFCRAVFLFLFRNRDGFFEFDGEKF